MMLGIDVARSKAIEENKKTAAKYQVVFAHPDAFDFLVDMLTILRWRGTLKTESDVARHNAAEEILALFGGNEVGLGWNQDQVRAQARAAIKG